MQIKLVTFLPKECLFNYFEDIKIIYNKLALHLKTDMDNINNMNNIKCQNHIG